jgi:hypothetical protein
LSLAKAQTDLANQRTPSEVVAELMAEGISERAALEIVAVFRGDVVDPDPKTVVPDTARPTGQELFDSLSKDEQDELLGPEKAEMVRRGEIELSDLVQRENLEHGDHYIVPKPLEDL